MAVTRFNIHNPEGGLTRTLGPGVETELFWGKHVMLSALSMSANAASEPHHHEEEQWVFLVEGAGVLIVGQEELDLEQGDVCHIPAGMMHNFIAGPAGARILDIFGPPREAYKEPGGRGFSSAS